MPGVLVWCNNNNNNNWSHPPTSGLAAPLAPPEETGEVARLEAVHQRALAHPALPEQLYLDPGHGLRGGRDILDIVDIIDTVDITDICTCAVGMSCSMYSSVPPSRRSVCSRSPRSAWPCVDIVDIVSIIYVCR